MSLTLFSKGVLDRFNFCWRHACTNKLLADWCGGSGLQDRTAYLKWFLLVESAEGFDVDGGQVLIAGNSGLLCNRGFVDRGLELVKKKRRCQTSFVIAFACAKAWFIKVAFYIRRIKCM